MVDFDEILRRGRERKSSRHAADFVETSDQGCVHPRDMAPDVADNDGLLPKGFDPSEDQRRSVKKLIAAAADGARVLTLAGPAGSGKSTLMRWLAAIFTENGWGIEYLAPTGKAAVRLRQVTGARWSFTIHGALYDAFDPEGTTLRGGFGDPHPPCPENTLVIVDEASMVDDTLHKDLVGQLPASCLLLYVGDREQLPPVKGTWGPNFNEPTAVLETVHRQAEGSKILALANALRTGGAFDWATAAPVVTFRNTGVDTVVPWIAEQVTEGRDFVAMTWTNAVRNKLNTAVRAQLQRVAPIEEGELLVVCNNSKAMGVMNGEVYRAVNVRQVPRKSPQTPQLWLFDGEDLAGRGTKYGLVAVEHLMGADRSAFFDTLKSLPRKEAAKALQFPSHLIPSIVLVDFAYCLTVHKCQGSEYQDVALIVDQALRSQQSRDWNFYRRFMYTGVTRARNSFIWWNV